MNGMALLTCVRLPARLDVQQTAQLLGFMEHDIPVLIRARLLRPLGNPEPNAHKYFSGAEIEALVRDRNWLDRATKAVSQNWKEKNNRRHQNQNEERNGSHA
jgi:hypothetical protein